MPIIPPKQQDADTRRRTYYLSGRTTRDLATRVNEWAQRNAISRSAALEELVEFALKRSGPDDALEGIDILRRELGDQRNLLEGAHDYLRHIDARLDAIGSLVAMAPLLLSHWYSHETLAREPNETPEQAEERMWLMWTEAGEIEWDARRRRVAPTAEEAALEQGEVEEYEAGDEGDAGDVPALDAPLETSPSVSPTAVPSPGPAPSSTTADDDEFYLV